MMLTYLQTHENNMNDANAWKFLLFNDEVYGINGQTFLQYNNEIYGANLAGNILYSTFVTHE